MTFKTKKNGFLFYIGTGKIYGTAFFLTWPVKQYWAQPIRLTLKPSLRVRRQLQQRSGSRWSSWAAIGEYRRLNLMAIRASVLHIVWIRE